MLSACRLQLHLKSNHLRRHQLRPQLLMHIHPPVHLLQLHQSPTAKYLRLQLQLLI